MLFSSKTKSCNTVTSFSFKALLLFSARSCSLISTIFVPIFSIVLVLAYVGYIWMESSDTMAFGFYFLRCTTATLLLHGSELRHCHIAICTCHVQSRYVAATAICHCHVQCWYAWPTILLNVLRDLTSVICF